MSGRIKDAVYGENDSTPFPDRVTGPELYSKIKNFNQPADPWKNIQIC